MKDTSLSKDKKVVKKENKQPTNKKTLTHELPDAIVINPEFPAPIGEATSLQARLRRAQTMRKYAAKLTRARKLARHRVASSKQLRRRSLNRARSITRQRLVGGRASKYRHMSAAAKIAVDRMADKQQKRIRTMATRLGPKIKRDDIRRLAAIAAGRKIRNTRMPIVASTDHPRSGYVLTEKALSALKTKAQESGLSVATLKAVFDRGLEAYKQKPVAKVTPQQWAFGRVNSYISKGKAYDADKDLREAAKPTQQYYGMRIARNLKNVSPSQLPPVRDLEQDNDVKRDLEHPEHEAKERELQRMADRMRRRTGEYQRKIIEKADLIQKQLTPELKSHLAKKPEVVDYTKIIQKAIQKYLLRRSQTLTARPKSEDQPEEGA
jgi:hypothetical protein